MRIIPWKQSREDCSRAGEKCNLCHWGVCGRACRLLQLLCTGLRGVGQGGSRCGKWNGAPGVEQLQYLAPVEGQPLFRCQLRFRGAPGGSEDAGELGSSELLSELELSGVLLELPLLSEALPEEWEGLVWRIIRVRIPAAPGQPQAGQKEGRP